MPGKQGTQPVDFEESDPKNEPAAFRVAATESDRMIAAWGASEDQLFNEYQEIRRFARERKQKALTRTA